MRIIYLFISLAIFGCSTPPKKNMSPADKIINKAIEAHGGKKYDRSYYTFDFRNKAYTFKFVHGKFEYTMRQFKNDRKQII